MYKGAKGEWLLQGSWGKRHLKSTSKSDFYRVMFEELVKSEILDTTSPKPSNKYHSHVTSAIMYSSWIANKWVKDESFASRLKRLREASGITQEQLAVKSELDVGTIRQLEQGTRTKTPMAYRLCSGARAVFRCSVFCWYRWLATSRHT